MSRLESEFQYVRETFFPRWDRQRKWRVKLVEDLDGAQARIDDRRKVICFAYVFSGDELTLILIHEIAHAAASPGHGRKWQERLEKATRKAESLGRKELAGLLRREASGYETNAERPTAESVYSRIQDVVYVRPGITFSTLIETIRREIGLSRRDFLSKYRRARRVFDEACKERRMMKIGLQRHRPNQD